MGNRSYGKGLFDGLNRGRAEGFAAGVRQNNWQTWAANALGAVIIVGGGAVLERRRERRDKARSAE